MALFLNYGVPFNGLELVCQPPCPWIPESEDLHEANPTDVLEYLKECSSLAFLKNSQLCSLNGDTAVFFQEELVDAYNRMWAEKAFRSIIVGSSQVAYTTPRPTTGQP